MILVSFDGRPILKLAPKEIGLEEFLQSYIKANPEVIPLDELKDDLRLLVVGREFPTPSGPIDVLAIDQDGDLYVIETKLFKNADKRHVMAQMFDYGAGLWDMPSDDFISRMNTVSKTQFEGMGVNERISDFLSEEDREESDVFNRIVSNKENGSIKFIVLMDQLDARLRSLIRYINANSNFDVLGVSLDFYNHDNAEIIIPHVYGAEVRKEVEAKRGYIERQKWDEDSFFEKASSQVTAQELQIIRQLYEWATNHADVVRWGSGKENGSFGAAFTGLRSGSIFAVYSHAFMNVFLARRTDSDEMKQRMRGLAESLERLGILEPGDAVEAVEPYFSVARLIGKVDDFNRAVEIAVSIKLSQ